MLFFVMICDFNMNEVVRNKPFRTSSNLIFSRAKKIGYSERFQNWVRPVSQSLVSMLILLNDNLLSINTIKYYFLNNFSRLIFAIQILIMIFSQTAESSSISIWHSRITCRLTKQLGEDSIKLESNTFACGITSSPIARMSSEDD